MTGRGLESLIPKKNLGNSGMAHPAPIISHTPEKFIPPPPPGPAVFTAFDPVESPIPAIRESPKPKEKGDSIFHIEVIRSVDFIKKVKAIKIVLYLILYNGEIDDD